MLSSIVQANTGKPFNALAGLGGSRNAVRAIDPATGQLFERNSFRADGFFSWDMRVSPTASGSGNEPIDRGAVRGVQHHRTT